VPAAIPPPAQTRGRWPHSGRFFVTPNYSFDDLLERARVSRERFADYVGELLRAYLERATRRAEKQTPVVAFLGMGRAGKDTSAEYFCLKTGLRYAGSASSMVLPIIADSIGVPPTQAWEERHQNRKFWIEWCHAFRHDDPTLLVKMSLGAGDVVVGVRGKIELHFVQQQKLIDYTVWVDNPRVPTDPTVEFGMADCDFSIPNHGAVTDLYRRIDVLVRMLRTPHLSGEGT
jgi:hypothetical protein